METKIIKAVFGGGSYAVTTKRTRTDYGQVLEFVGVDLPDTFECIFSNSATSSGVGKKMIGTNQQVLIPDEYLATGQTIYAWVLVHDSEDDGRHMYNVKIPVDDMPDLSPEEPTPVEQSVISQAITALNTSVEKTAQDVIDADASAQSAKDDADRAERAKTETETARGKAEEAQESAERAQDNAETSERNASESERKAKEYAETASEKADSIHSMTASAQTLPAGSSATASYDAESGGMSFGIPKGDKGDEYILTAQDKQDIADMVDVPAKVYHPRITALNNAKIMDGEIVEVSEIPEYVDNPSKYSEYGITEVGWYVFVRIQTKGLDTVSWQTTIDGADGYIANVGADYVDVAIRFEVASTSKTVTITWKANDTEVFVFKAVDLAVRNLDYRTTFYVYDITHYRTWSYALTSDTEFAEGKNYYILSDGEYVLAEVTAGEAIPADTYYNHSKLHFEGMARNVTYNLPEIVDCPIEIVLPEIPKSGYGAWFDIQMRYDGTHSCTLLPPEGVKIGTAQTQSQTKGVNIFELQYTDAGDVKMWTLLNTHSNIPS